MRHHHQRSTATASVMAVLALTLMLSGCSGSEEPEKGQGDVQVMTEAEVTQQVNQLAEQVRMIAQAAKPTNPKASSAPCDTDTGDTSEQVRYVQGTYGLPVPAGQHLSAFQNIRDHWQGQGWTITTYRVAEDTGRGTMSIKAPDSGVSFTLTSTAAPDTLGLLVHSNCYRDSTFQ